MIHRVWINLKDKCTVSSSKYDQKIRVIQSKNLIFLKGLLTSLDSQDKSNAFTNSELPNSYVNGGEPLVQPGQNKGLYLMLDAHSDLFSASSVDSDNEGFIGLIHPKGAFPFTMLEGFNIRPG